MLYIQKSVSENAGNCSNRGRKTPKFSGGQYLQTTTPALLLNAIPHQTFCYQQTIYHFSTLGIVWSLFVDAPPPPTDEFLKNALCKTLSSPLSSLHLHVATCHFSCTGASNVQTPGFSPPAPGKKTPAPGKQLNTVECFEAATRCSKSSSRGT